MQRLIALIAIFTFTSGSATAHPRHQVRLPATFARWQHVMVCEESGPNNPGGNYPDPEGIDAHNWAAVHGPRLPLGRLSLKWQIVAVKTGDKFIAYLRTHGYPHQQIPDAGGCASW